MRFKTVILEAMITRRHYFCCLYFTFCSLLSFKSVDLNNREEGNATSFIYFNNKEQINNELTYFQ